MYNNVNRGERRIRHFFASKTKCGVEFREVLNCLELGRIVLNWSYFAVLCVFISVEVVKDLLDTIIK